jgi:hypothetical protein
MISDNLGDWAITARAEQRDVPCLIAGQPVQLESRVWMRGSNHGSSHSPGRNWVPAGNWSGEYFA